MQLFVTVVAAPGFTYQNSEPIHQRREGLFSRIATSPVELMLDTGAETGAGITERLAREVQIPVRFWVDGKELGELRVGQDPLISGAVIVVTSCVEPAPVRQASDDHRLVFAVLSGPDAGGLKHLKRGQYSIGRIDNSISIADPQLSRHQAQLAVEATNVQLKDCRSANGTWVNRSKVGTAPITVGSSINMGSTSCSLRFSDEPQGSPPRSDLDPSEPLVISRSMPPQRRGMIAVTAMLPVAIGVGLALVTGMWIFLAFSAMSALTMLLPIFGGRSRRKQFRRDLEVARNDDYERRTKATPFLADTIRKTIDDAARCGSRGTLVSDSPHTHTGGLRNWIRVGMAAQPANLRVDPPDRNFTPPILPAVPVALNLVEAGQLAVTGNRHQVEGVVRSVALQISQWNTGDGPGIVFCGRWYTLPLSARFLPRIQLVSSVDHALSAIPDADGLRPVLFIDLQLETTPEQGTTLQQMVAAGRLNIVWYGEAAPNGSVATVALSGQKALLRNGQETLEFVPDMVNAQNYDRYCRARARLTAEDADTMRGSQTLPPRTPLDEITNVCVDSIQDAWRGAARDVDQLQAPLGTSLSESTLVDLQADGPHLLLAGTTGSGKSELLRTLILSLSMHHSPSKVNFLFVDFKGGSGLGPLQQLPHCVGMLTDLSSEAVGRAMDSLRSEVRRRETLFAQAEAVDLASYQQRHEDHLEGLSHLVLVIDEYRMLLEEVPQTMDELLRIATLGRSLGIHLVMATQRPQGAVSADIRANVTTSIALRVQSGMESQDVIGSTSAADISVETPGRAYIRRGTAPPEQFQSASTAEISGGRHADKVVVTTLHKALTAPPGGADVPPDADGRAANLARYITTVSAAWKEHGEVRPVRHPVRHPLPDLIDEIAKPPFQTASTSPVASTEGSIPLGLLDLPSRQWQEQVSWQPTDHSHLALIGPPKSGVNSSMRHIVRELLHRDIRRTHLYVLDSDGTLPGLSRNMQVGAYVGGSELRRAVRVVERLAESLSERLADETSSLPRQSMATNFSPESGQRALLVLSIAGWGRWLSSIRNSPWPWVEDTIQDLIRDGGKAGIVVIICGDRELVTSRFLGMVPNRIYLPTGASPETTTSWPKLPAIKKLPGRAFLDGNIVPAPGVGQLIPCSRSTWRDIEHANLSGAVEQKHLPFRVARLPRLVQPAEVGEVTRHENDLLLGVQGDELRPATLRLGQADVLLILGSVGSGKSTALDTAASTGSPARRWVHISPGCMESLARDGDVDDLDWPKTHRAGCVLLVDDADQLSPQAQQLVADLHKRGCSIIMTATTGPAVMTRIPLAMQARSIGKGIVLAPRTVLDGDFFGVRLEVEPRVYPGRGMMIQDGVSNPVQFFLPSAEVNESADR